VEKRKQDCVGLHGDRNRTFNYMIIQTIKDYGKLNNYLNSFSVGKWVKYTDISDLKFEGTANKGALVQFCHGYYECRKYVEKIILEARIGSPIIDESDNEPLDNNGIENCEVVSAKADSNSKCKSYINDDKNCFFSYNLPLIDKGIIYVRSIDADGNEVLVDGSFVTESVPNEDVRIALNICTYNREEYLFKNIGIIKEAFLDNTDSELKDRLEVFITDNASSIDIAANKSEHIHIVHNPNTGGSGGFTRGLREILKVREDLKITHSIFMDDDITLNPEAIRRTYVFLSFLKPEYSGYFIGGAQLRQDEPTIQHECGALWNAGHCIFTNRGLDVSSIESVAYNEIENPIDYAAWWYCCIPASIISEDTMPMPFFIHGDDVEYSLHNAKGIITLNGIAVWHPVNVNTRPSSNEYYNHRNMFYINERHVKGWNSRSTRLYICTRIAGAYMKKRYKDMYLLLRAVRDYKRGEEWLYSVNPTEIHKEIAAEGYRFKDVTALVEASIPIEQDGDIKSHQFFKQDKNYVSRDKYKYIWGCIAGLMLEFTFPHKKLYSATMDILAPRILGYANVVLYDKVTMRGVHLKKEKGMFRELIKCLRECSKLMR